MINGIQVKLPDPTRDHIQGATGAPVALLEYGDYECPFCGEVQPIVREIQRRLGDDLCFAFRHFPLTTVHPYSEHAAEAAEAAGAQGNFWGMHETLFRNQQALDDESLAGYAAGLDLDARRLIKEVMADAYAIRIREDFKAGVRAGVNGTPSFFINGQRYDGAHELEPMLAAILQSGSNRRRRLEKLQSQRIADRADHRTWRDDHMRREQMTRREENRSLYLSYLEFCNKHDVDGMASFYTSTIKVNDVPMDPAAVAAQFPPLFSGFPDWHWEIRHLVVDGDNIAVHFTVTGTHRGVFREIEATGRRVTTSEFTFYHIEDGKFAEVWDLTDMDAVMRQIRQGERH